MLSGEKITSSGTSIQVVNDAPSSKGGQAQGSGQGSGGESAESQRSQAVTGEIPAEDLFLRFSLSRSEVVIGEPVTASLKLCQRVNIAGFENAKFPSFNGFWSQEVVAPTNLEFRQEQSGGHIYDAALALTNSGSSACSSWRIMERRRSNWDSFSP